jgi:hypothetical protein
METEQDTEEENIEAPTNVEVAGKKIYIDGYLKDNLDRAKEIIKQDWDIVFLYDGYEGCGKSVKAMQDCFYFDQTFNMDRICFDPRQFTQAIRKAEPYQAVLYDEAFTGLNARAAMSLINRTLIKMLAEIRQKKLFVAIVMPTFFDLDRYVAIWRSRALIHVYMGKNFQRGYFMFFNMERKKQLYVLGKKYYSYYKPDSNFKGRFTNTYVIDEKEYRKRKKDSLMKRGTDEEEKLIEQQLSNRLLAKLANMEGITIRQKAEIMGIPEATFYYKLKNYRETGEL